MTTTKIVPAEKLAKELGVQRKIDKRFFIKDFIIEQLMNELRKNKGIRCEIILGSNTLNFNYKEFTREDLVEIGKEIAKDFKDNGYEVNDFEYASSNTKKYYSLFVSL